MCVRTPVPLTGAYIYMTGWVRVYNEHTYILQQQKASGIILKVEINI